jgi:hypothetical protein
MPTHTRRVIRTAVRTHNYVHAPIRSAGSLIRKTSFASRSIRRRQRSSFADLNALRGSSPRNASVGARERLAAYRRFMFARNDLLFTMSDNTRMQTTRERDALHARISFHGRATKVGLPSRSSRQLARLRPSGSDAATFHIASRAKVWWSQTESNRRPPACKAGALPTELWPLQGSDISNQ